MEQKLYFSDTPALTSEIANDITDKELNHATQNFVESLTKGYQKKKESDPNFFLSNKVLQKRFPLNLSLFQKNLCQDKDLIVVTWRKVSVLHRNKKSGTS